MPCAKNCAGAPKNQKGSSLFPGNVGHGPDVQVSLRERDLDLRIRKRLVNIDTQFVAQSPAIHGPFNPAQQLEVEA